MKKINKICKNLSKSFEYYVLFKRNSNDNIFDSNYLKGFKEIKTAYKFWTADPFIYKGNNRNYVFSELGNRVSWKGTIGYYCLDKKNDRWHPCIKEKWHLSFPNIFKFKNEIYMMCETNEAGYIYFYKCLKFPNRWEKIKTHLIDGQFVDSDVFIHGGNIYIFTYSIKNSENVFQIYKTNEDFDSFELIKCIEDHSKQLRLAGKVFNYNGDYYLPTQDCEVSYGHGIIINKINLDDKSFDLKQVRKFTVEEFEKVYNTKAFHLHTLNFNDDYILLDASRPCESNYVFFYNFFMAIKNKLKRFFSNIKKKHLQKKNRLYAKKLNISFEGSIELGKNIQNWGKTKVFMKDGSRIGDNTILWGGGVIAIGESTSIGENSWIFASGNELGGVEFGKNVECAANLYVIDSNHMTSKDKLIQEQPLVTKKIIIGDDVWIGANVTIIPGAKLSSGCVVGACSLVNKPFQPYEIVAGVPAKKIKNRE